MRSDARWRLEAEAWEPTCNTEGESISGPLGRQCADNCGAAAGCVLPPASWSHCAVTVAWQLPGWWRGVTRRRGASCAERIPTLVSEALQPARARPRGMPLWHARSASKSTPLAARVQKGHDDLEIDADARVFVEVDMSQSYLQISFEKKTRA